MSSARCVTVPCYRAVSAVAECGTDMLELDCHLSRDGRVVVSHDPHLRRSGRPELAIAELDHTELPPLLDQLPLDFVPGEPLSESEGRGLYTINSLTRTSDSHLTTDTLTVT